MWTEGKACWLTDSHHSPQEETVSTCPHTQGQVKEKVFGHEKFEKLYILCSHTKSDIRLNENQATDGIFSAFLLSGMSLTDKDICQGRRNPWGYLLQLASHIVSPSPTLWGKEPCPRGVSLPYQRSYAAWGKTVILPGPPFSHLSSKRAHFPCLPPTILGEIMEGRNKWNLARKINLSVYRHLYIFSSSLFFLQVCFSVLASPF